MFPALKESKAPNDSQQLVAPSLPATLHDRSRPLKNTSQSTQPVKPSVSFSIIAEKTKLLTTQHPSFEPPSKPFTKDRSLPEKFPQPAHLSGNPSNSVRPKLQSANCQFNVPPERATIPGRPAPSKSSFQQVYSSRKTTVKPSSYISRSNHWSSIENREQMSANSHQSTQSFAKSAFDDTKNQPRSNDLNKVSANGVGKDSAKPSNSNNDVKQLTKDNTNAELSHNGKLLESNASISENDHQLSQSTLPNTDGTIDSKAMGGHNTPLDNWEQSENDHPSESSVNSVTDESVKLINVKHQLAQIYETSNPEPSTMTSNVDTSDDRDTSMSGHQSSEIQGKSGEGRMSSATDSLSAQQLDNSLSDASLNISHDSKESTQPSLLLNMDNHTKLSNTDDQTVKLPDTFADKGLARMTDVDQCSFPKVDSVAVGNTDISGQDHQTAKLPIYLCVDDSSRSPSTENQSSHLVHTCTNDSSSSKMSENSNLCTVDTITCNDPKFLDNSQSTQALSHHAGDDSGELPNVDGCSQTLNDICIPSVDKTAGDKAKLSLDDHQSNQSLSYSAMDETIELPGVEQKPTLQLDNCGSDLYTKLDYSCLPTTNITTGNGTKLFGDVHQPNLLVHSAIEGGTKLHYVDDHSAQSMDSSLTDASMELSDKDMQSLQISVHCAIVGCPRVSKTDQQSTQPQENGTCILLSGDEYQSHQLSGQSIAQGNSKLSSINLQSTLPPENFDRDVSVKLFGHDNQAIQLSGSSTADGSPMVSTTDHLSSWPMNSSNGQLTTTLLSNDQPIQLSEQSATQDGTNPSNINHQSSQLPDDLTATDDIKQSDNYYQSTHPSDTLSSPIVTSVDKLVDSHRGASYIREYEKSSTVTKLNPGTVDPKRKGKEKDSPSGSQEERDDDEEVCCV